MKYLKGVMMIFVISSIFAVINVNASQTFSISNITIPILKGTYSTSQKDKETTTKQYIKKTKCTDDVSGDGRAILAKVHGMLAGMEDSSWVTATANTKVSFGSSSQTIGGWKLWLQSNKSLLTTATFSGVWTIDN